MPDSRTPRPMRVTVKLDDLSLILDRYENGDTRRDRDTDAAAARLRSAVDGD